MRRILVAQRTVLERFLATIGLLVIANESESRIAADHLAVINIEHAAARTVHRMHLDLVKPLQHSRSGPQSRPAAYCLCRQATTPKPACDGLRSVRDQQPQLRFESNALIAGERHSVLF